MADIHTATDRTLVIIDDEPGFRSFVARVAESCGLAVFDTDSVHDLVRHVRSNPPTAVILDLRMPGLDGVELLRDFARQAIPSRIFLASGVDAKILETAWQLGCERGLNMAGVIRKPVRVAHLRELLNGIAPAAPGAGRSRPTEAGIEEMLTAALEDPSQFHLVYQPKLDLRSGRVTGAEALARWCHPQQGLLAPDLFIPAAERSSLIHRLTKRVVDLALQACAGWREAGHELGISINISARDAGNLGLPDWTARGCEQFGLDPASITMELTETAVILDTAELMDVLTRFRLKGFNLALDDFGTGHSSLVRLQKLPFSELKIDKSFLLGVPHHAENTTIARTLISMGHELGLLVTAEGVETREALDWLRGAGCPSAQGYHIGRPMGSAEFLDTVRRFEASFSR